MNIQNPNELVGKTVCDTNGNTIGIIDKTWKSWNNQFPGYFFGVRLDDNVRATWFRGTTKLIPIYSEYIREYSQQVYLNFVTEELVRFWNKTVNCGVPHQCWPMDELVEKPVYDKEYHRMGTFFSWVEQGGTYKEYGMFLDPYLCVQWHLPNDTLMPVPTDFLGDIKDTIQLNRTIDEMRTYWQQQNFQFTQQTPSNQYTQPQQDSPYHTP